MVLLTDKKSIIQDFEATLLFAELKALSNTSLERPLDEKEFTRMKQLRDILFPA